MSKRILVFIVVIFGAAGILPAQAAEPDAGVFALSSYIPADMNFAAGLKIDDETIAAVDGLIARGAAPASDVSGTPVAAPAIRDLLSNMNGQAVNGDAILDWAGDSVMIALKSTGGYPPGMSLTVIALDDAAAAEEFFKNSGYDPHETQGRFRIYGLNPTIMISDEVLIAVSDSTNPEITALVNGDYPRLSSDEAFAAAIATLPESDYALGMYVSGAALDSVMPGAGATYGSGAFGLTMLDDNTLAIDIGTLTAAGVAAGSPVDEAFTRFIPADSSAFALTTGLGGNISRGLDLVAANDRPGQDTRGQIAQGLAVVGLNLDELLKWSDGNFAAFGRFDAAPLLGAIGSASFDPAALVDTIQLGLVVETLNPENSTRFARSLASLIRLGARSAGGLMTVTDETVSGVEATVVTISQPMPEGEITVKLAMAATGEVFILGTYNAVAAALTETQGMDASPLLADAAQYMLPDAETVFFVDGKFFGQSVGMVGVLALLGPSVQQTFDALNGQLLTDAGLPTPTPRPPEPALPFTAEQFAPVMERFERFIRHATVSTRTAADGLRFRATLTLGE